jgi:hypothetical protein
MDGGVTMPYPTVTIYSSKELELIRHYELEDVSTHLRPWAMYQAMAVRAFLQDDRSAYAETLRRCLEFLQKPTANRMTPGFEALFNFDVAVDTRAAEE